MSVNAKPRLKARDHDVRQESPASTTDSAFAGISTLTPGELPEGLTSTQPSGIASTNTPQTTISSYSQPVQRIPLVTTFTPDSSCSDIQLSQLPPPGYLIWANEPVPAPSVTYTGCYPSEFLRAYTSVSSGDVGSSIVPAMGPMVCPKNWCTQYAGDNNYAVCCPSGYQFHRPDTTIVANRPGYGGTCYSDLTFSSTYTLTAFNISGATNVAPWVASKTGMQAYAHPIDGFVAKAPVVGCPAKASPKPAAGLIAGVVLAGLSALVCLLLAALFALKIIKRRMQKDLKIEHVQHDMGQPALRVAVMCEKEGSTVSSEAAISGEKWGYEKGKAVDANGGWGPYEMSSETVAELDTGYTGKKDSSTKNSEKPTRTAEEEAAKRESLLQRPIPPAKDLPMLSPKTYSPRTPRSPRSPLLASSAPSSMPNSPYKSQWERRIAKMKIEEPPKRT